MNGRYTPDDEKKVRMHLPSFKKFIFDRGGEILAPTNEWELIRFSTASGLGVIYRKQSGLVTFYGHAGLAWRCYINGSRWTAGHKARRKRDKQRVFISALKERDGDRCFYCGCVCDDTNASVEHLIPLNCGGSEHIANKVLACQPCNREAGHMPVIEKIKLRENKMLSHCMRNRL